jgi:Golgi nucleoside diphosphatase
MKEYSEIELFEMLDQRLREMEENPKEFYSVEEAIYFAINGYDLPKNKPSDANKQNESRWLAARKNQ